MNKELVLRADNLLKQVKDLAEELRDLIDEAYDAGYEDGYDSRKEEEAKEK